MFGCDGIGTRVLRIRPYPILWTSGYDIPPAKAEIFGLLFNFLGIIQACAL